MPSLVCTLFEKDHYHGVAALVNSIYAGGFRGVVHCGFRGPLPPFAKDAVGTPDGLWRLSVAEGLELCFEELKISMHFTTYKPTFLKALLERYHPEQIFYFDPDIVVKCPWELLERWARGGVALCEDVNSYFPPRHPLRLLWQDWLTQHHLAEGLRPMDRYYSGGFIGLGPEQQPLIELWEKIILLSQKHTDLKIGHAWELFCSTDQDALNMALICADFALNTCGPEGMDFAPGGYLLSHAIGPDKPWRGRFILQALQGKRPTMAQKSFFAYTSGPLRSICPIRLMFLRLSLSIASAIGRFYHRA